MNRSSILLGDYLHFPFLKYFLLLPFFFLDDPFFFLELPFFLDEPFFLLLPFLHFLELPFFFDEPFFLLLPPFLELPPFFELPPLLLPLSQSSKLHHIALGTMRSSKRVILNRVVRAVLSDMCGSKVRR